MLSIYVHAEYLLDTVLDGKERYTLIVHPCRAVL